MYIKKVHILIEQGLQEIGVFAYSDFQPEEVDLQINKATFSMINDEFEPIRTGKIPFQKTQGILDRFQTLEVKDLELIPYRNEDSVEAELPANYIHLIRDESLVLTECSLKEVKPGDIEPNQYYMNIGTKTIIYNSISYPKRTYFKGIEGFTSYSFSGVGELKLIKLKKQKSPNRLIKSNELSETLLDSLTRPDKNSPVSTIAGNKIFSYFTDFIIDKLYISYIREPKEVNYNFKKYTSSDALSVGKVYESIDDNVTYNSIIYKKFEPFTVISGVTSFTGGTVRELGDGDLELPKSTCYKIIDKVINVLMMISEQSQQKISNLKQENV